MDRLDLHLDVPAVPPRELRQDRPAGEASALIRARVLAARACQTERFKKDGIYTNSQLSPRLLKKYCELDPGSRDLLEQAMTRLSLSARAYGRIVRVARTIADLAGSSLIAATHLAEAIQYRGFDRQLEF